MSQSVTNIQNELIEAIKKMRPSPIVKLMMPSVIESIINERVK